MNKQDVINKIKEEKIIAIVRGISNDRMLDACEALSKGGVNCIEVTFDQSSATGNEDTYSAINMISDNLSDVCVGAGTVMSVEQVELAAKAGAKYIISPNFDKDVVKKTVELGLVSIPGVLTPTEISNSCKLGADMPKLFPAGHIGLSYIKNIKVPLSHIPMIAVGGINVNNVADYMAIGIEGVGVGSSLVNKTLINKGRYDKLTELASQFVKNVGR